MYQDNHIKYVVNCTSEMQRWTFRQSDWACLWGWPATTNGNKADCVENRSPPPFGQIQIRCSLKWGLQVWYCHTDCIQIGKLETSIAGHSLRSHFVRFVLPPVYCLILTNDGPLSLVSNMRGSKILSSLAPMLAHITTTQNRKRMGKTQAGVDVYLLARFCVKDGNTLRGLGSGAITTWIFTINHMVCYWVSNISITSICMDIAVH